MVAAVPKGYEPDGGILAAAKRIAKDARSAISVVHDPYEAATGADIVYTDVWVSMGMEAQAPERERAFQPYQLNEKLMSAAKPDAIVMHCLPAHRGLEITDGVLDGPQSAVLDQAENRLHAQKAILARLLAGV